MICVSKTYSIVYNMCFYILGARKYFCKVSATTPKSEREAKNGC